MAITEDITVDSLLITIKPTNKLSKRLINMSHTGGTLLINLLSRTLFTNVV